MRTSIFAFILAIAAIPACFGATKAEKTPSAEGDATLLDHNSYSCSDCFFGTSDDFYCFKLDSKILIAHEHVLKMNYSDPEKNYLTKAKKNWVPWTMPGQSVHVKYNDKYLWVPSPIAGKKDIRMEQKYTTDIFLHSDACREMIHAPAR